MTLFQEYKRSLKMAEAEEVLDLAFYRPIAFGFVKLIYRLPVTPNQVTMLSLLAGLAAAWCFTSDASFAWGGAWFALANVLDCSDGQLARLQNSGTPLGRLIDGVVDWIITVAVFACLGVGLSRHFADSGIWLLIVAAGVSSALHAITFDYHQQEYIANVRGRGNFLAEEQRRTGERLAALAGRPTGWWQRTMLQLYTHYLAVQERTQAGSTAPRQASPELYRKRARPVMRWWTLLGSTMNRSLLIVTALAFHPEIYLWVVVIAGNIIFAALSVWQRMVERSLQASTG